MKLIGGSINEAIDWTQDKLHTTRPMAERTLFSMMAAKLISQTEDGYVLRETSDDDEPEKHHRKIHNHFSAKRFTRNRRRGLRIHEGKKSHKRTATTDVIDEHARREQASHVSKIDQRVADLASRIGMSYYMLIDAADTKFREDNEIF